MRSTVVALLSLLPLFIHSIKLPSYIEKCSATDPNIGDCIRDRFHVVKPHIIGGVKEFHIPPLNPFHLEKIGVQATKTLNVTLTDVNIYGIENFTCVNATADMPKLTGTVEILMPFLHATAHYDIHGNILVLPISGNGPAELNITNARFWLDFQWKIVDRHGENYAAIVTADLKYKTELMRFHLDNLFNGNKALGDEMNVFINDNWKEFAKEIEPAVSQTILKVILSIYDTISKTISFDELFLP